MGETTNIGWTDHTWNPWIGCAKVSPGCKHCYAENETYARVSRGRGLDLWGVNAARHITTSTRNAPLAWAHKARQDRVRRRVFCLSLGDFFEDRADLRAVRADAYRTMAMTADALDYLVLTKRPENAGRLLAQARDDNRPDSLRQRLPVWLDNIVLGATAEDQACLDERLPHLLRAGAARTFLSCEPLLGPLDLSRALEEDGYESDGAGWITTRPAVDWVIVGGESERKAGDARVFDLAWARAIVKQCAKAKVPCFVKQMGANAVDSEAEVWSDDGRFVVGTHTARAPFTHPKGEEPSEWPRGLQVRAFVRGIP